MAAISATDAWAVGRGAQRHPDPALERHHLEAGAQPEPGAVRPDRSHRDLPNQRLGGRLHQRGARVPTRRDHRPRTLILHWNGTTWKQVPSPNPAGSSDNNFLTGVAAASAADAWAVGTYTQGGAEQTLVAHWNGTTWKQVPSPNPSSYDNLASVAATSATNAWAVGATSAIGGTLIAHWNGTTWKQVPSPHLGNLGQLFGMTAPSPTNIWAVGSYQNNAGVVSTLALHHC